MECKHTYKYMHPFISRRTNVLFRQFSYFKFCTFAKWNMIISKPHVTLYFPLPHIPLFFHLFLPFCLPFFLNKLSSAALCAWVWGHAVELRKPTIPQKPYPQKGVILPPLAAINCQECLSKERARRAAPQFVPAFWLACSYRGSHICLVRLWILWFHGCNSHVRKTVFNHTYPHHQLLHYFHLLLIDVLQVLVGSRRCW